MSTTSPDGDPSPAAEIARENHGAAVAHNDALPDAATDNHGADLAAGAGEPGATAEMARNNHGAHVAAANTATD